MSSDVSFLTSALTLVPTRQRSRRLGRNGQGNGKADAVFVSVSDLDGLDRIFASSKEAPAVLFLHDPYCPISTRAHQRVHGAGGEIHMIDVSKQHELSREIAERTGVRHESPQAFVLYGGEPVWYASHGAITTEGLAIARGF
jgi:bacillithiol system protein YtxJ